jgi:tetratricopeptide (TPR) repeat protein
MAEANRRRTHERASSALAAYDRALALRPLRSDAHAGRGLALLDLGRRPEALAEFQRALELDPRDGVAVLGLAETYRSLGRSEEARRAYQRYLDGWPGGAEAQAARAALESLKE